MVVDDIRTLNVNYLMRRESEGVMSMAEEAEAIATSGFSVSLCQA